MTYAKKVISFKETTCIQKYEQHATSIQTLKTYKQFVITGSSDNTIKVRHLGSKNLKTFQGQKDSINRFDINSDGQLLMILAKEQFALDSRTGEVLTTYKKDIHIYNLESEASKSEMIIENINGNSVIFAGNYIISGNDQGYICIWDIQTNKLVRDYKTWHKQAISSLFYDSKEDLLIIGSKDGMLNALHLKSFIDIRVDNILSSKNIENYKIWIRDIQKFNDKELTFYITKSQSKIILWKLNEDQCIEPLHDLTLARIDSRFYCMSINPSGKKVVVGGNFGL